MKRILLDTNVLVYAHDRSEPARLQCSRDLLEVLSDRSDVFLTSQILGEFFRVVTRKLTDPLSVHVAAARIETLRAVWEVLPVTEEVVVEAIRGVAAHKLPYWDAQLWACARLNQVGVILSEDFQDGRVLETVRFRNPFAKDFELERVI